MPATRPCVTHALLGTASLKKVSFSQLAGAGDRLFPAPPDADELCQEAVHPFLTLTATPCRVANRPASQPLRWL